MDSLVSDDIASLQSSASRSAKARVAGRRLNACLLRSLIGRMLKNGLPQGWTHQMIASADAYGTAQENEQPDIVIISPSGRCHFLFAKAPADRWWDGDIHRVAAEALSEGERRLIARLRQGGNRARAVWSCEEVVRTLAQWGCRLTKGRENSASEPEGYVLQKRGGEQRPKLKLSFAGE